MTCYDSDDEILVGEVFGIVDFIGFHGVSIDELKGSFNARNPSKLHKKIAMLAAQQQITLNQYVVNALSESV